MISPEILRRYPFFAGLSHDQLVALASCAREEQVEAGHRFFREDEELDAFYLVLTGQVALILNVTSQDQKPSVAQQLTSSLETREVTISQIGAGEPFGWTSVTPNSQATAGAMAATDCGVLIFDRHQMLAKFEEDCAFGYRMMQKIVQVARERMHALRVESLAQVAGFHVQ